MGYRETKDKRRRVLGEQFQIKVPDTVTPELGAFVIAQMILKKSNVLPTWKKVLREERNKYIRNNGEDISKTVASLKAFISKNQASFFAKASAGICTDTDLASFHREDHFHMNTVDMNTNECMGNLMIYAIVYEGKKSLFLRGFNPNTTLLKNIDAESYCEGLIKCVEEFARANGFHGIYMSETLESWHALTNRSEIQDYLQRRYAREPRAFTFPITGDRVIDHMYLLRDVSV